MTGDSLHVAIIGAGLFAETHMAAYSRLPGADIAAVVDVNSERAAEAARIAGGVPWSTSLSDILADPSIDAVDICTPNFTHSSIAIAALEAGKHVLVEKPPALSLDDFDRMTAAAERSGATLTVGLVLRHTPWVRALRAEVDAGHIGTPLVARLSLQSGVSWPGGARAWQRNTELSGGHIVHNGMHLIDLANWFLGAAPVQVMARGFGVGRSIDDHWTVNLRYENDAAAVVEYSYSLPDPQGLVVEATIIGTEGVARFSSLDLAVLHTAHGDRPLFDFRGDSMTRELDEFTRSARTGTPHGVDTATVRHALSAALLGQQSLVAHEARTIEGATRG